MENLTREDSEKRSKELPLRKFSTHDSLDVESHQVTGYQRSGSSKAMGWPMVLQLAFQSIGVVYGDIGTSPLYVLSGTFPHGISDVNDVLGVLSLILYTLTVIPLIKYVFIVLHANDNGDGGTFALYSLICRYANVGLIPSKQAEDCDVSNFKLELPSNGRRKRMSLGLKSKLENSRFAKHFLFFATLLGTSMIIGDGILTPCVSVLSAVGGIKKATSAITQENIVWIAAAILIFLFMIQRFGTQKIGYTFSPILLTWFVLIACIGLYNIIRFDPRILRAVNPWYIIDYFRRNKKEAWMTLGGIILCTTGAEALFADVGHFTVLSIQISTCCVVYPALVLQYIGQASVLSKHPEYASDAFYKSVPAPLYWPMVVMAILAAVIASQSLISATFSIIQQSLALGCFPRVKIVHTSAKHEGQVYIPEANYLLMLACVGVVLGFRSSEKLNNAYGLAVVFVMALTSCFLVLVMILIWKSHIIFVILYVLVIASVEFIYLSSVLYKFEQGGYLPIVFAVALMTIMFVWNNVYRRKYYYELENKISPRMMQEVVVNTRFSRLPGLAIFYSELVHGVPPIFKHYIENVPALHSVLVFISIKSLHISKVPAEERFIFRRLEHDLNMYRCVVRYGYMDIRNEKEPFEGILVEKLKDFISEDNRFSQEAVKTSKIAEDLADHGFDNGFNEHDEDVMIREEKRKVAFEREIEMVDKAWQAGVVHLIGENEVIAAQGAGMVKRIMIDYAYNFLKKNLRENDKVFDIPHKRMLKVGMTYEL